MSRRHFSALLVTAIVVVLAVALLVPGKTGRDEPAGNALLLPDMGERINEVTGVTVTLAGGEAAATLQRDADQWRIEELSGYPADFAELREVLAGLAQAEIQEYKTENPGYYHRLGVEDIEKPDASGVLVELAVGAETTGVILGNEAGNRSGQYVRLAGAPRSILIDRVLDVPTDLVDWADRDILDVGSYSVAEVEIIHPDGDWVLARKASANDTDFLLENLPEGRETLSSWAVNSLAGIFSRLRMDSVRPDTGEAAPDAVKIRLLTFPGVEYIAEAWSEEEGNWLKLQATVPADPDTEDEDETAQAAAQEKEEQVAGINERFNGWAFEITESKYVVMTKHLEDILKQPEEPDPTDP